MDKLERYRLKLKKEGKVRSEFVLNGNSNTRLNQFLEKYEEVHGKAITRSECISRLIDVHLQPEFMSDFQSQDEAVEFS